MVLLNALCARPDDSPLRRGSGIAGSVQGLTGAAMLQARQARARYDTAKDLFDELEGKRAKKKRSRKAVR
jgi:hypothetical protein